MNKVIQGFLGLEFCKFTEQYFITRLSSGKDIERRLLVLGACRRENGNLIQSCL